MHPGPALSSLFWLLPAVATSAGSVPQTFPWHSDAVIRTQVVNSLADTGPGSLREAILQANALPGPDLIRFASDGDLFRQPQTIVLNSPLPEIRDALVIDGYIDDMLWQASGVTLDGQTRYRILSVAPGIHARISYLTLTRGSADKGGALFNAGISVLSGVLLDNNRASDNGGALYNAGSLFLINSTLHGNSAHRAGGALYHAGTALTVTHSTFDDNAAPQGGAIYSTGPALMNNSIVANSRSPLDCLAEVDFAAQSRANIIEKSSGCTGIFSREDPGLGKLGRYNGPTRTIPINSRSPAFNRADNAASLDEAGQPLTWDQRGNGDPRFAVGIADIGAFEVQPQVLFEVDTRSDEDIRGCTRSKNDCSLRGALTLLNQSRRHQVLKFDQEVFRQGVDIHFRAPLPPVTRDLTIDASEVGTVRLGGNHALRANPGIVLETINVRLQ
ncbi:hypothetical protein GCM10011348_16270 [Marinobacterium nitratireducens]|uniref:Uncharacterized protein n=1 Tax=Marinobacterium nitratireducens TaxID=518897 RepID=A0A917ZCX2_9GAMM|nr:choice-of-anchor Q domain-containing protein [Marinobacterium nitratireducens]GGO80167.1 hypothetical protein GCM10011348_16270 [Marinobacterium nitratireducens]